MKHLYFYVVLLILSAPSLAQAQAPTPAPAVSAPSPIAVCELGLVQEYGQEYLTRVQPGFAFKLFGRVYPIASNEMPGEVCARAVADQELLARKDNDVRLALEATAKAEKKAGELQTALDRELRPNTFKENYAFYALGFFVLLGIMLLKPLCSLLFLFWRVLTILTLGWRWQKSGGKWSRRTGGTLSSRTRSNNASFF